MAEYNNNSKRESSYKTNRRPKKKVCQFCVDKAMDIDYKDVNKIRRYTSERAKILPRRVTGTCAKHQRLLTIAIKRARHIALLPYSAD
jgi:small subunit ribosomal protein S18